jgi:hypothetical protein
MPNPAMQAAEREAVAILGEVETEVRKQVGAEYVASLKARLTYVDRELKFECRRQGTLREFAAVADAWNRQLMECVRILKAVGVSLGLRRDPCPVDEAGAAFWRAQEACRYWLMSNGPAAGHDLAERLDQEIADVEHSIEQARFALQLRTSEVAAASKRLAYAHESGPVYDEVDSAMVALIPAWHAAHEAVCTRDMGTVRIRELAAVRDRLKRQIGVAVGQLLAARAYTGVLQDIHAELDKRKAKANELADLLQVPEQRREEMVLAATAAARSQAVAAHDLMTRASAGDLEAVAVVATSTSDQVLRDLLTQTVAEAFLPDAEIWTNL